MAVINVIRDAAAACAGALIILPQAVACGLIAVSPLGPDWAVLGITVSIGTAILFGLVTGAFASNPFLVSGPGTVTSLVFATGIAAALARGLDASTAIVIAFSAVFVGGLFQLVAGVLRLEHIASYMPLLLSSPGLSTPLPSLLSSGPCR